MLADFRAAALRLLSEGLTPEQAAERLDHRRLGDFYLRAPDYWYPLDDAAKIYPMSMTDGWMSVFRLSAWLDAPVAPELLPEFSRQLGERASEAAMRSRLGTTAAMVRALGRVPLFIKRPAARLAYGFLGERAFTSTLSNLGRAALPEELARHVGKLGFVLGTGEQCRASCAMVTFGGTALLSITKLTEDPTFEKWLCTLFERAGVPFELEGSVLYGA